MRVLPGTSAAVVLVRPPGSVPEERFLAMCVRCGACETDCTQGLDIMDRLEEIDAWEKKVEGA